MTETVAVGRSRSLVPADRSVALDLAAPAASARRRWRGPVGLPWWCEILLLAALYALYSLVRNGVGDVSAMAFDNATSILHLEDAWNLAVERGLNAWVHGLRRARRPVALHYATLHFLVTPAVLVWLYRRSRPQYRVVSGALMATTAVALLGFYLMPTAPPRLLRGEGFVDVMSQTAGWGWWPASGAPASDAISNQFAAMPSLHCAWALWCGIVLFVMVRRTWVRVVGALYPLSTFFVVMGSGNHFLLDVVAGVGPAGRRRRRGRCSRHGSCRAGGRRPLRRDRGRGPPRDRPGEARPAPRRARPAPAHRRRSRRHVAAGHARRGPPGGHRPRAGGRVRRRRHVLVQLVRRPLARHVLLDLVPALSLGVGSFGLLVLATLATTALGGPLSRGTAHPTLLRWCIAAAAVSNMVAGRVAFGVGAAIALAAVLAVLRGRSSPALCSWLVSGLASPLAPAFVGLATVPLLVPDGHRDPRVRGVLLGAAAGVAVPFVVFGAVGWQPFPGHALAWAAASGLAAYPALRGTAQRWLLPVVAPVTLVLFLVPTGVGSNLGRFSHLVLPCLVLAWSHWRGLRLLLALLPSLCWLVQVPVHDQTVAIEEGYAAEDYAPLRRALLERPDLAGHRVELVDNSSHAGSHRLGPEVLLARGWENQADAEYNASITDEAAPDAADYRKWLTANAVAYVAVAAEPLVTFRTRSEIELVESGLPYLTAVWTDANWTLYRVEDPAPIVPPPLGLVELSPARLVVEVPDTATHGLRIRPNQYLVARSADDPEVTACLQATDDDWVTLRAPAPGRYVVEGDFSVSAALGGELEDCA